MSSMGEVNGDQQGAAGEWMAWFDSMIGSHSVGSAFYTLVSRLLWSGYTPSWGNFVHITYYKLLNSVTVLSHSV